MARRDFVSIPAATGFIDDSQLANYFEQLRENVELLAGLRGADINHALVRGDVEVARPSDLDSVITASTTVSDAASLDAVIALRADVAALKDTLDALIVALRTQQ